MRAKMTYAVKMRGSLVALALVACTPTERTGAQGSAAVRTLELPGVAVEVPAAYVPLEAERVARLRAAALREDPAATVEIAAVRDAAGLAPGTVYVQRTEFVRPPVVEALTVRETLARMGADLQARLGAAGLEIVRTDVEVRDGALEGCVDGRMTRGERSMALRNCMRFVVTSPERVIGWNVHCMTEPARVEEVCGPVVNSRRFTAGPGLAPEVRLPANAQTGA